ncbi:hypothetical protein [Mesorhizobium sp. M0898]|uniref:hypothetical protein n=1 Tax=Mesorhizobium sp. M0898 TaxID=2957020 RepID=UPI0033394F9F
MVVFKDPDFNKQTLSLFEAAMFLANAGKPVTYRQATEGDMIERGAALIVAGLRTGRWVAKGTRPGAILPEDIPASVWTYVEYDPPLLAVGVEDGYRGHLLEFVDHEGGRLDRNALGMGGSLTGFGETRATWQMISIEKSSLADPHVEAILQQKPNTSYSKTRLVNAILSGAEVMKKRGFFLPTQSEIQSLFDADERPSREKMRQAFSDPSVKGLFSGRGRPKRPSNVNRHKELENIRHFFRMAK